VCRQEGTSDIRREGVCGGEQVRGGCGVGMDGVVWLALGSWGQR